MSDGFWRVVDGKIVEELPAERLRVVERETYLRDVKAVADRIGEDVTESLNLPDDVKVVYILDAPTD